MKDSHKTLYGNVFEMGDIEMSEETREEIKRFENNTGRCINVPIITDEDSK